MQDILHPKADPLGFVHGAFSFSPRGRLRSARVAGSAAQAVLYAAVFGAEGRLGGIVDRARTMGSQQDRLFERLRTLVVERMGMTVPAEVVPIEQTLDGWFVLYPDGSVCHRASMDGEPEEGVRSLRRKTALIGFLCMRFPLGTAFLPKVGSKEICGGCNGSGRPNGLPGTGFESVVCECGGLGWRPRDEA